ncbi:MAG: glycosyltransferase [Campylobacterales bacterium]|nr:glycosyltransferase [Campylobacterales bacterium]
MNNDFSVLMSIYKNEKAEFFDRAMFSIWDEQTIKPSEIVLVQDGPLPSDVLESISKWKYKLREQLVIVTLENNVGLGDALNIGMHSCTKDLIARMDTDDIAMPQRFEKQLKCMKSSDIEICGSWVNEFENSELKITSIRRVPETHKEIVLFSKKRNPINHPSVMFKRKTIENVGGYKKMMYFEDYYLWIRIILDGAVFYNIQESLLNMRAGHGQLERRRGFTYFKHEYEFFFKIHRLGHISNRELIENLSIRLIARLIPRTLLREIYTKIRRR